MFNKQYIICSAIYIKDKNITMEDLPENINGGLVIAGRRHSDAMQTVVALKGEEYLSEMAKVEGRIIMGFLTNDNWFLTREDAVPIAKESGQLNHNANGLISEHLY